MTTTASIPQTQRSTVAWIGPLTWLPVAALLAFAYAADWLDDGGMELGRPFVYRQLVPLAARLLSPVLDVGPAVVLVTILCAMGFALSVRSLYRSFYPDETSLRADIFTLASLALLFLTIIMPKHNYDVPTAFLFTLSLALLARGHLGAYAALFPLVCLNRETAFLLPLLFAVYFYKQLEARTYWTLLGYQALVFVGMRLALMWIFAGADGSVFYFRPLENLQLYAQAPVTTNFFLLFFLAVGYLVRVQWGSAPRLMRTACLVFAPLLLVLYLVLGTSFEIRVFVELLPAVLVIAASPRESPT